MILHSLFRLQCPACEQPQPLGHLCDVCRSYLAALGDHCLSCAEPMAISAICGQCLKRPPNWDAATVPWRFEGLVRFLIHRYKYQIDRAAGHALLRCWTPPIETSSLDAFIPVPMHHRKEARHGFNHARDMADFLSRKTGIPVFHQLKRVRATQPLEGMKRRERQHELKGCFQLTRPPPRRVAIIDDVMTTGSTLNELSRTLKQSGTQFVAVWALARTPLS